MKFIGLFAVCFLLIVIVLAVFESVFPSVWGLIAVGAFLMALVIRMFMSLDERLDRIEQQLGIKEEHKTLTEQLEDEE